MNKDNSGNGPVNLMRKVFSGYDDLWQSLPQEYGVVVICRDNELTAYGDAWRADDFSGKDFLDKNLAGAQWKHKDRAFLVVKIEGIIICTRNPAVLLETEQIPDFSIEEISGFAVEFL